MHPMTPNHLPHLHMNNSISIHCHHPTTHYMQDKSFGHKQYTECCCEGTSLHTLCTCTSYYILQTATFQIFKRQLFRSYERNWVNIFFSCKNRIPLKKKQPIKNLDPRGETRKTLLPHLGSRIHLTVLVSVPWIQLNFLIVRRIKKPSLWALHLI